MIRKMMMIIVLLISTKSIAQFVANKTEENIDNNHNYDTSC